MADTTTPNMNLIQPEVSAAPGPGWATTINGDLSAIDSHNHTPGQGVQITPDGININSDLAFSNNNLTTVRSVNFTAQAATLSLPADLGCIYVSLKDLYYNDEDGNQVRITQSGSVTGSTGTITGLPSGTASASYSAGTFTFQGATNTPATMAVGPLVIGRVVALSKTVTISPNSGQLADFGLTLPAALPGSTLPLTLDTSGNIAAGPATGTGSVVLATAPTFAGVPAGTITGASFSPTVSVTKTSGSGTISSVTPSSSVWYYQRIGNVVSVTGNYTATVVVATAGVIASASTTLPIATAALIPAGFSQAATNTGFATYQPQASGTTLVQILGTSFPSGSTSITWLINFSYAVS